MPNMPAFCADCGLVFASGFMIENSINTQFQNVQSRCPRCGGTGKVPDGVYNVLGGVVELLSGPSRSVEQLQELQQTLIQARMAGHSREEVQQAISQAAPELTSLSSALPSTRGELYAFLSVVIALLTLLVGSYAALKSSSPSAAEIEAMIANAVANAQKESATPKPRLPYKRLKPKIGRNAACPCGSGKKYKRCCLASDA